jgi:hypothetical protein
MLRPWKAGDDRPRTVLVFAVAPLWIPHFETELEIIAGHHEAGDTVHVASCHRGMDSCLANPHGHRYACMTCISRANSGFDVAAVPASRRHVLDIRSSSDVDVPEFASFDALRAFKVDGVEVGAAAASSLISILRESHPDVRSHGPLVRHLLESGIGVFRSATALLSEVRPDLAYVFNGRYASTLPLIRASERAGVPFVTHEAGYELGTYRLISNSTIHVLDTLKRALEDTWNQSALTLADRERIGREFFVGRRTGGEGDAVEEYQFARRLDPGHVPEEVAGWKGRRVVVFNSSEDEFAVADTYANPVYKDQLEALEAIALHTWPDDTRIIIREHPNLRGLHNTQTERLQALGSLRHVTVIGAESTVDSYALLEAADLAVTFGSTIGAEAVFWGCPSVLIGRAPFEDLGVIRPTSHEEVVKTLLADHDRPLSDDILRFGFFQREWSVPFERFHQDTFRTGTFAGVSIRPARPAKLASVLLHVGTAVTHRDERRALTGRLTRPGGVRQRTP